MVSLRPRTLVNFKRESRSRSKKMLSFFFFFFVGSTKCQIIDRVALQLCGVCAEKPVLTVGSFKFSLYPVGGTGFLKTCVMCINAETNKMH